MTHGNQAPPPSPRPPSGNSGKYVVIGFIIAITLLLLSGLIPRFRQQKRVDAEASEVSGPPIVTVAQVKQGDPTTVVTLPATLYGLHETGLYVRTNGYVRSLRADMGEQVKAGDTLAVVEMPELDQELNQARATLAQVMANGELTKSSFERWKKMAEQGVATQQEFDERQAAYNANQAGQAVARSNVDRLSELKRFGTLIAPFSGVVTARNIDVGALVSPTVTATTRPLFSLVQVDTLRVVTSVPQNAAPSVKVGQTAEIRVQELGGAAFKGVVTRTAQALDLSTRTLLTEIEVPNRDRRLLPGMFGQVKLELAKPTRALMIPANTLIARSSGPHVAVVRDGKVAITKITTGRDFGSEVELLDGVAEGDQLVVNPGDHIVEGLTVRIAPARKAAG
ncbi:MAG: efflux RND transporter periplasmic adaptor subunit [Gemmatimonas sp.]